MGSQKARAVTARQSSPRSSFPIKLLVALTIGGALAACWILPYRLRFGPDGSHYTIGFIGDEYYYTERISPLLPGTTGANHVNGMGDPNVISPFFLDAPLRAFITLTGMDVFTFVWIWKILFGAVLCVCLCAVAAAAIPRSRRPWAGPLKFAAAAAAFPLLYCLYDAVTPFPPLGGMINRFASNIEYPLSLLLAWAYLRFLQRPDDRRGVALALVSALNVYLRPYNAIPWGLTVVAGVLCLLAAGRLKRADPSPGKRQRPIAGTESPGGLTVRTASIMFFTLLLCLSPLMAVNRWNSGSVGYRHFMLRFDLPMDGYVIHPRAWVFLASAAIAGLAGLRARHLRLVLWPGALTMAALPFVSCLLPIPAQVTNYDRYGVFYLPLALLAGIGLLGRQALNWRGKAALISARRWSVALCGVGLLASGILAWRNWNYDFHKYPLGPYPPIVHNHRYLPAYEWIRSNTPPEALFLLDNGVDFAKGPLEGGYDIGTLVDLFHLVAQRRRLFNSQMFQNPVDEGTYVALLTLHVGTFGSRKNAELYKKALLDLRPDYVFWRKGKPIPRGLGKEELARYARNPPVYSDDYCEIWKLELPPRPADPPAR